MVLTTRGRGRLPRPWRLWLTAFVVAVLAMTTGAPNAAAAGWRPPIHSGLAWPSGVYNDGWTPSNDAGFASWRGRAIDTAVTFPARTHWSDFVGPSADYTGFEGQNYTMVFAVPPIPEDGSATMAGCAAGSYNSEWTTFGNTMTSLGLGSSIIRLGWEFNGNWFAWGGGDPATFAACWRQIVSTVRAVAPNLKFDWNVNRESSAGMPNDTVLSAYPGDAYVDIVGVDSYDWYGDWDTQLNGAYGLNYWLNFAKSHGKDLSVPEWGLYPGSTAGYGDDPGYIQHMHDFFAANAAAIAYESYFNESASFIADSIWNPVQNPNSANTYNSLW
jgi:Glycosyl hydrolase family 26